MRVLLTAICILVFAYAIKIDLEEGALNFTDFYETEECEETFTIEKVRVKIQAGDTLYSLFAVTPFNGEITSIERVSLFYELNPHLRYQSFVIGESIYIPVAKKIKKAC